MTGQGIIDGRAPKSAIPGTEEVSPNKVEALCADVATYSHDEDTVMNYENLAGFAARAIEMGEPMYMFIENYSHVPAGFPKGIRAKPPKRTKAFSADGTLVTPSPRYQCYEFDPYRVMVYVVAMRFLGRVDTAEPPSCGNCSNRDTCASGCDQGTRH